MVYYIIHKCSNNNTFGALFARFNFNILLKLSFMFSFAQNLNFNIFTPFYLNFTPITAILLSWIWRVCLRKLVWVVCHKCYDVKLFIPRFSELYDTHCELTTTKIFRNIYLIYIKTLQSLKSSLVCDNLFLLYTIQTACFCWLYIFFKVCPGWISPCNVSVVDIGMYVRMIYRALPYTANQYF